MQDAVSDSVLRRLQGVCRTSDLEPLAQRLASLSTLVAEGLSAVEAELEEAVSAADVSERLVARGAAHLFRAGGKRLRPTCVLLAAAVGGGDPRGASELAVVAEMVHAATLLHDDVVDQGELRRGKPTTRALHGNAASIYAGDWLLVEALRRVRRVADGETLDRLLEAIDAMIVAESLQLESRGRLVVDEAHWRRVAEGKTASLFAWAMFAGGRAGGARADEVDALERFGRELGVAFQAVDDVLDFAGEPESTGKALFADLRDGKVTYPLILAARREPDLERLLGSFDPASCLSEVLAALRRTGALDEARAFARDRAEKAREALAAVRPGPARDALETVLVASLGRSS